MSVLLFNTAREPPDDKEWPASDSEIASMISFYPDLVQNIDNKSLVHTLWAEDCISAEHRESILIKGTNQKKNRELLEIMMRRSVRQLETFYHCLKVDHAELWQKLMQVQGKLSVANIAHDSYFQSEYYANILIQLFLRFCSEFILHSRIHSN